MSECNTISAKALDVGYDKRVVVNQVNIEGLKGQIICLLGPNGAGKSTILRTLSGLLAPIGGCVEIGGDDLKQIKQSDISKKLSVVLTDAVSPNLITVYDLVAMGRTPYTNFFGKLSEEDKNIIQEALITVGVAYLKDRYFSELSDGEKQKVMIARALVQEPELIVLDEPTSHLDIRHKVEVIRILRKLAGKKNITVILSLHDIDLAIKGCQTVLLIKEGQVIAQGTPEDIINPGTIGALYNVSGAVYNELLGAVEIQGDEDESDAVFVVGGNGTGVNVYRAISREGFGMTTGVLHENDIDTQVAVVLCRQAVIQAAFTDIDTAHIKSACALAAGAAAVVDTGFPLGNGNKGNIEVLQHAIAAKKKVFSLRDPQESAALWGAFSSEVIHCPTIHMLVVKIKEYMSASA